MSSTKEIICELEKQIDKLRRKNIELERTAYISSFIVTHSADLVSRHSLDGRYKEVSDSYKTFLGYEPHELVSVSPYDLFFEGHIDAIRNSHNKILSSKIKDVISYKIRHKNGSYVWLESYVMAINTKTVKEIISVSRDITKIKKIEEDLQECKRRKQEAEALAHVGSWELDLTTNMLWASPEAFRIYGITGTNSQIPLVQFLERILPKYRIKFENLAANIGSEETFEGEFKIRRLDNGNVRLLYTKAEGLMDDNNHVIKVIGVIQDITDRKKREEKDSPPNYHDKLTGVYNKQFILNELERLNREGYFPFSVIIGKINGQKDIISNYGRSASDELFINFAIKMKKFCRSHDIVARFSKDEIIILFHDTDEKTIESIFRRLDKNVHCSNNILQATLSYGFATKENIGITVEEFIKSAKYFIEQEKPTAGISLK